jgi:CDGSH-type Zn-finger protein
MVEGRVEIANGAGEVVSTEGKALPCRCGGSQNKLFCAGTHWSEGFKDPA